MSLFRPPFAAAAFVVVGLLVAGCGADPEPSAGEAGATAPTRVTAPGGMNTASELPRLGAAPSWQLTRLDGSTLSAAELEGKVAVIDFWATWCPPCIKEIPGYVELQEKYGDDGLVIVGISLDQQGPEVVQRFVERNGINYPIVMGDEAVAEAFGGVRSIPTTFLIDREGQIRHQKVGAAELSEYEPLVRSLL